MDEFNKQQLTEYLQMQYNDFNEFVYLKSELIGFNLRDIFSDDALMMAWVNDHGYEEHLKYFGE